MWFRRRRKTLLRVFLVVCPLFLVLFQMYTIVTREDQASDVGHGTHGSSHTLVKQNEFIMRHAENNFDLHPAHDDDVRGDEMMHQMGRDAAFRKERTAGRFSEGEGGGGGDVKILSDEDRKYLSTELKDIFISVKTTGQFHKSRVDVLLRTWFTLAIDQTYFFTDDNDAELVSRTGGHAVNTNCSSIHSRDGLCCKMSVEYDYFVKSQADYRWFCHVDDDTYVNIPALVRLLQKYDHIDDWYLGKPSLSHPLEIPNPDKLPEKISFWFATGGAGFCISRGLALKMMPYAADGRLQATCSRIRLPDDCTIAFILSHYLNVDLTSVREFHSHLESLRIMNIPLLAQQITLSYSETTGGRNIVKIPGFEEKYDPTRFLSIHCFLFPNSKGCTWKMQSSPKRTV